MEFVDQMNRKIRLDHRPSRIVSLVPSQTELLHYFGLEDEVVGITKFCISPNSWFKSKERVGGTKNVNLEKIKALKPDLIIGNKEENTFEDIIELEKIAPVWMSDIYTLEDALNMIFMLGKLLGKYEESKSLIQSIEKEFKILTLNKTKEVKKVLYFIWKDPHMVAGKNTFVDDLLNRCGFENETSEERYPEVDFDNLNPDFVFLSSEPFPFSEEHMTYFKTKFPNAQTKLVDGEMFSWYGSRLLKTASYLRSLQQELLH